MVCEEVVREADLFPKWQTCAWYRTAFLKPRSSQDKNCTRVKTVALACMLLYTVEVITRKVRRCE